MFSDSELAGWAARASSLQERIDGRFLPAREGGHERPPDDFLQLWASRLGAREPAVVARRLALDATHPGVTLASIQPLLGPVRLAEGEPLPAWTRTLRAVMAACRESAVAGESFRVSGAVPAFAPFYQPFIQAAMERLEREWTNKPGLLSPSAATDLRGGLRARLVALAQPVLSVEGALFRALHQTPKAPGTEDDEETAFTRHLLADHFASLFCDYPVLARLLCQTVDAWVAATRELLERLERDGPVLEREFPRLELPVNGIQSNLSDPHHGGRSVCVLTFASGARLVYKPRGLALEAAYARLLAWINTRDPGLADRAPRVLDQGDYGWVEFIAAADCADEAAVRRYHERAGQQLCLVYALVGSDFHCENLIAAGEFPVLIDLEVLIRPRLRNPAGSRGDDAVAAAAERLGSSVLNTGLLPGWTRDAGGRLTVMSGLGRPPGARLENASPPNQARLGGVGVATEEYVSEITRGFAARYEFILKHRDELLAPDGPLADFEPRWFRFVNRNTRTYRKLLLRATEPERLTDGRLWSLEFEGLYQPVLQADPGFAPGLARLIHAEVRALEAGDYPCFLAPVNGLDLSLPEEGVLPGYFALSGIDACRARIAGFSPADLALQSGFIHASFALFRARHTAARPEMGGGVPALVSPGPRDTTQPRSDHAPATPEELVAAAADIARRLREQAIRSGDSATWIAPQLVPDSDRFQLSPLSWSLYEGQTGVILFLAAMFRVTGDTAHRELARAALHPVLEGLRHAEARRGLRRAGPGAGAGLGGMVYALASAVHLLGDSSLLEPARVIADLIDDELLATDRKHDVIAGAAGGLLGLLRLHEANRDPIVLERAWACGRHLLAKEAALATADRPYTACVAGYSHGAAGVISALSRLHSVTDDAALLAVVATAITQENRIFAPAAGNWPAWHDRFSPPAQPVFLTAWCHGASGILLSRLDGLRLVDTPEVRGDIAVALATTRATALESIDHCCCGNFGRVEVLHTAGLRLDDPALCAEARTRAGTLLRVAQAEGGYACFGQASRALAMPGFFSGESGIGYTLLRLARPDLLPCALLFE